MSECNHNCSSCGEDCKERTSESMLAPLHERSKIKKVIGVVSGKGGVGKSLVTSLLACGTNAQGKQTAILDADITGPSIPQCFGVHGLADVADDALLPMQTKTGIQLMSINLLLEQETQPVIFRGPIIAGTVKQFWSEVIWSDVDVMFVDMPPGTGDVPLTVFQSIPVDGIIVVTTPQDLVSLIVGKAVKMAEMMNIPVLGIVENMSYAQCPDCGRKISVFGESHVKEIADQYGLLVLCQLPINPELTKAVDTGKIEDFEFDYMDDTINIIEKME